MDITFPNVHFILNKSTKTNIRYLQYLHGNFHLLWSFFQFDGFKQGRQQKAAWRSEMITCWIYIQSDAEQPTDDSINDLITFFFFGEVSKPFIDNLNPSYELCDNYWICLPGQFIVYNINSKKKIKSPTLHNYILVFKHFQI